MRAQTLGTSDRSGTMSRRVNRPRRQDSYNAHWMAAPAENLSRVVGSLFTGDCHRCNLKS